MSAVIRNRPVRHLPVSSTALWVLLGLAAAFFLVRYGQELLLGHELNDKAAAQRVINSQLQDENTRLKAALEYYRSDKYIEQRAREDLNLRRPDEEVLIPISATPQAAATPSSTAKSPAPETPSPAGGEADEPNWQRWLDLFSPAPATP